MADFDWCTARVSTGAAIATAADVDALVAAGVSHIIDCIEGNDDAALLATHPAITYLYNGTQDDGQPKPPEWFQRSIGFALSALAQPHNKVYAHCAAGVNRGPSTAFAILRAQGFSSALAETVIRAARPQVGLAYKANADTAIQALGYQ